MFRRMKSFKIGRLHGPQTPTALALYRTPECWRFSLSSPDGIACGVLDDLRADSEPQVAKRAVEQRAREFSRRSLEVTWSAADGPDSCTGEVIAAARRVKP